MEKPSDILTADRLIFPGVGAFGQAMRILNKKGLIGPLKEYLQVCYAHVLAATCMVGQLCVASPPCGHAGGGSHD